MGIQNWNLVSGTSSEWSDWVTPKYNVTNSLITMHTFELAKYTTPQAFVASVEVEFSGVTATEGKTFATRTMGKVNSTRSYVSPWSYVINLHEPPVDGEVYRGEKVSTVTRVPDTNIITYTLEMRCDYWASGSFRYRCIKVEYGKTATPYCGTFDEEYEKAIAQRDSPSASRLTLTALGSGSPGYITNYQTKFFISKVNVPYINLQWNRALYEAGSFEVQLKADDYNAKWSALCVTLPNERLGGEHVPDYYYEDGAGHGRICTATGHYELGLIYKREFTVKNGQRYVLLSGLMMDSILDGWVCLDERFTSNVTIENGFHNACETGHGVYKYSEQMSGTWSTAEDRAIAPSLTTADYSPSYRACVTGDHFRPLLERRGLGIACAPYWRMSETTTYVTSLYFVKAGIDRTRTSEQPVVLGCAFGNVASEEVTVDDSAYKVGIAGRINYTGVDYTSRIWTDDVTSRYVLFPYYWHRGYLLDTNNLEPNTTTQTVTELREEAQAAGWVTLQDYVEEATAELDVSLLDIDTFIGLGLGDTVTVYLSSTDTFENMRIVGFSEVCKGDTYSRKVTLGSKRLTNAVRAAKYAAL